MEELGNLGRVPLDVEAVLDARMMTIAEILQLECGSLIRMNRAAGENVQIQAGGVWIADGDILAVDNKMCVRLTGFRERP
jgi:flagellar motor switch/type III secretory pathway protein FliN